MSSVVQSLNVSAGGVPKLPIQVARLTAMGLDGDVQRNKRYHGGPMRALCLFSFERIQALQREGHPIAPGTAGENVTISGLEWSEVVPGVVIELGVVAVAVTSYTRPCKTIRNSFLDGRVDRIAQDRFPGWSRVYASVVVEGDIRVGDAVWMRSEASRTVLFR